MNIYFNQMDEKCNLIKEAYEMYDKKKVAIKSHFFLVVKITYKH